MKPFNEKEREKKVSGQYVISGSIPIEPNLPPNYFNIGYIINLGDINIFEYHALSI